MSEQRLAIQTISIRTANPLGMKTHRINIYEAKLWRKRALSDRKKFSPSGSYLNDYFDKPMFRIRINNKWLMCGDFQYSFYTIQEVDQIINNLRKEALREV